MKSYFDFYSDLSDTSCELENAINLLVCLMEFFENEGYCPNDDATRMRQRAITFFERMPQHAPLLYYSVDILRKEHTRLTALSDDALELSHALKGLVVA